MVYFLDFLPLKIYLFARLCQIRTLILIKEKRSFSMPEKPDFIQFLRVATSFGGCFGAFCRGDFVKIYAFGKKVIVSVYEFENNSAVIVNGGVVY